MLFLSGDIMMMRRDVVNIEYYESIKVKIPLNTIHAPTILHKKIIGSLKKKQREERWENTTTQKFFLFIQIFYCFIILVCRLLYNT